MTTYSHSRLSTFEQCKQKYKFQYVDKIKVDIPDTIETFVGSRVHEALEKLYKDLQFERLNTCEELFEFFEMRWEEEWSDTIIINDTYSIQNHKDRAKRFIRDYYDHYKPFNHLRTLGLETEDRMQLENGNQFHIRIDRLACDKEGNYYVMDYKTNKHLKAQDELDEDRQLAMYSMWVKNRFADCQQVKLVWYFLAHDKEMVSERSEEQLASLKAQVEALIKEVEKTTQWPTNVTALCGWCKFKQLCPAWKHEYELEKKSPEEFKEDDGVRLVDDFAKWDAQEKEAKDMKEMIKDKLIHFADYKGVEQVFGTEHKVKVSAYEKFSYPKTQEFVALLKEKGVYDDLVTINYSKFASVVKKGKLDIAKWEQINSEKGYMVRVSKR